jgi:ribosomal protein S18 acetylase RimI-like enzyme
VKAAIEIVTLSNAHFDSAWELDRRVSQELGADIYAPFANKEQLWTQIRSGFSLGAFAGDKLVAARFVEAPAEMPDDLLDSLRIPAKYRAQVAALSGIVVARECRRLGLARSMSTRAIETLRARGWHYLYATVAPSNFPSLRYLFGLGFTGQCVREMYHSGPRLLVTKSLAQDSVVSPGADEECFSRDIDRIQSLCSAGYRAFDARWCGGEVLLKFFH